MFVLVTYDVATSSEGGKRRLRRVAKACLNYGQRVQNSVFECVIDPKDFEKLKAIILSIIDQNEDSIRFYHLNNSLVDKVDHYGVKETIKVTEPIIL